MIDLNGVNHTSYLVQGEEKRMIVESGYPSETVLLYKGLKKLDLTINDIDYFIATHIHLDHVGAAGFLAEKNPKLKIFIHEIGVKHLINPKRLNLSAKRAYGPIFNSIGEMKPVPPDQVFPLKDHEIIDLGGNKLKIFFTPGHAKHHIVILIEKDNILFSGDALGAKYPGVHLFIVTPPPDYNMELAINSIELIKNLKPSLLLYTHFGPIYPENQNYYDDIILMHKNWCGTIQKMLKKNPNTSKPEILNELLNFTSILNSLNPKKRKFWEVGITNSFKLSIEGILRYLKKNNLI